MNAQSWIGLRAKVGIDTRAGKRAEELGPWWQSGDGVYEVGVLEAGRRALRTRQGVWRGCGGGAQRTRVGLRVPERGTWRIGICRARARRILASIRECGP